MHNVIIRFKLRTILVVIGVIAIHFAAIRVASNDDSRWAVDRQTMLFAAPAFLAVYLGGFVLVATDRRRRSLGLGFLLGTLLTASTVAWAILTPQAIVFEDVLNSTTPLSPQFRGGSLATQAWQSYFDGVAVVANWLTPRWFEGVDEAIALPIFVLIPHLVAGSGLGILAYYLGGRRSRARVGDSSALNQPVATISTVPLISSPQSAMGSPDRGGRL